MTQLIRLILKTNNNLPTRKTVKLTVDSKNGGRWIYPFTIHSTSAEPDDNIVIRASGLHKDSVVGIRLNSLDRYEGFNLVRVFVYSFRCYDYV